MEYQERGINRSWPILGKPSIEAFDWTDCGWPHTSVHYHQCSAAGIKNGYLPNMWEVTNSANVLGKMGTMWQTPTI